MVKIGATIIGTETELILKSTWVVPTKLLQEGFTFSYPGLTGAVENIVAQVPRKKYRLF
jgi:NAD dependent epimerase/dehydratase family enzyme